MLRSVAIRMQLRFFKAAAMLASALVVLLVSAGLCFAAEPGIYTATATPTYASPLDGSIADSAGESNTALGQSMVSGVVHSEALVEIAADGSASATLRFNLANEIGDVLVSCDASGSGTFSDQVLAQQVQVLGEGDVADYRFPIPSEDALLLVTMYVEPMGRDVTYFVMLSDLTQGNSQGFVESIDVQASAQSASSAILENDATIESSSSLEAAQKGETPSTAAGSASQSSSTPAASSQAAQVEEEVPPAAADGQGASLSMGVKEYNGDGNEVTGLGSQSNTQEASALDYPLLVGGLIAVAAIAGLIVYFAYLRPKRERQDRAAAAAGLDSTRNQEGE